MPAVPCKGLCHQTCGFPPLVPAEIPYLRRKHGIEPMDMFGMPIMPVGDDGTCKMLSSDRRCTIHADRPLSCRMYGSSSDPRMKCAWGCVPSMVLPPEALAATMEAARSIR